MPSLEASLRNLERAKQNWRAPRPLRCRIESLVIRRLVWQWHHDRGPRKWSARAVAPALGVSHTYIQKLVREFVENPDRILRELRTSPGVATVDTFERAQRETHRDKERGYIRSLNPWRMARVDVNGTTIQLRVPTKTGIRQAQGFDRGDLPGWASGRPCYSSETPCDPFVAVRLAAQQLHQPQRLRLSRRWRPGMHHR
jgi:hypothetical protein